MVPQNYKVREAEKDIESAITVFHYISYNKT